MYGNNPQTSSGLKTARTEAIEEIPRTDCKMVTLPGTNEPEPKFSALFLSTCKSKSFGSTDLKVWGSLKHSIDLLWLKCGVHW